MSRYIDAEELKEEFEDDGHLSGYIEDMIDDVKTADVQEVIHSKWRWSGSDRWNDYYTCLNCGAVATGDSNYCPRCGARMDGVE